MRLFPRSIVLVAAVAVGSAGMAVPALAAPDSTEAVQTRDACVVNKSLEIGSLSFLTPMAPIAEDVAFNGSDPDADSDRLELIRFPNPAGLWADVELPSLAGLLRGVSLPNPEVRAFAFTGPERWDTEISDSIVRLYCGLFDRQPAESELEYWVGRYRNGLPLVNIAEAFTHSYEFVDRFGALSDAKLVVALYREVLGRVPSPETVTSLVASLESGDEHRGQVVVKFTESAEYVARTRTVPPVKPILPYPDTGSGRRIVYSNGGQRVWLIDASGELFKTHQVTGRRGIPAVGRYRIYSMSRYAWAPYDGITMEYMVRFARGEWPYGFHSIPVYPDEKPLQVPAKLGTHGSGGCVRQLWDDAVTVFEWSTIGTRVIVTP